jgi:hypothetical protein
VLVPYNFARKFETQEKAVHWNTSLQNQAEIALVVAKLGDNYWRSYVKRCRSWQERYCSCCLEELVVEHHKKDKKIVVAEE